MIKHIENVGKFGIPWVVWVNKLHGYKDSEIELVITIAKEARAFDALLCTHWAHGGKGAELLGQSVIEAWKSTKHNNQFNFLYPLDVNIEEKMESIVKEIYGAGGIEIEEKAEKQIELCKKNGWDKLPICMAKTHLSMTSNLDLKGIHNGFKIPIKR